MGVLPLLQKVVLDDAVLSSKRPLLPWLLLMLAFGVAGFVLQYQRRYLAARTSLDLQHELRLAIQRRLHVLDFARHDQLSTGDLMSRAAGDVTLVQMFVNQVPVLVSNLTLLVVALVVMLSLSPLLSLVIAVFVPAFFVLSIRFRDRQLFSGEQITFEGRYVKARGAQLQVESVQQPHPEMFFAGSSDPAISMAARQMQTYLTWGEPVAMAVEKIQRVKDEAQGLGRTLRYGMRLHLIIRDTDDEAWAATQRIYDKFDKSKIEVALKVRATSDSVGVRRTTELIEGREIGADARALEVAPNLWAGYTLTGKGPGTALVGSPRTIADRLLEYYNAGIDTFILSGSPRLEEAYRVAEQVFPLLPFEVDKPVASLRSDRSLRAILDTKALASAG